MRVALLGLVTLLAAPRGPDVANPGGFFERLPPPKEGEWRWRFPQEKGQTFAAYRGADPVRATGTRRTIYLQPLLARPPRDPELLPGIAAFLEAFFGRPAEILPPQRVPARAYARPRRQVSVAPLAAWLHRRLPDDALLLLAVTDRDLYVGRLDHVYGWGSLRHRVGVMSVRRVAVGEDEGLVRWRTLTLAAHEACHMLSLPHCTFYGCLMNGARALDETDRRPALLCCVCRAKLCWNLGDDPRARYGRLEAAWRAAKQRAEAARVRRAAAVSLAAAEG